MSGDYDSNFDTESEAEDKRSAKRKAELSSNWSSLTKHPKPSKNEFTEESDKNERKLRTNFQSLDVYSRHKMLINEYILNCPGSTAKLVRNTSKDVTEYEVLRDNHRFIWEDSEEELSWGQRLAKKYYKQLFKEYCISDLSRYKDNQFGMRWRTEKEVVEGKGQFSCGAKNCDSAQDLKSWEVLFAYQELGEKKRSLVKLRLCDVCSLKLNYKQKRKQIKKRKKSDKSGKRERKDSCVDQSIDNKTNAEEGNSSADERQPNSSQSTSNGSEIWSKPQPIPESDKPIDDEFDRYLEDLLL